MKYSMMSYSVARQTPQGQQVDMQAICDLTVKMGLDALDQVTLYGYDPADLRNMAHDHGIKIICYTQSLCLAHEQGPERDKALAEARNIIDIAGKLNAPMIMLALRGQEGVDRAISRRQTIECLADIIPWAQQAGVLLTVEHFPNPLSPFIISDDMQEALDVLPDLRITFDNGNVLSGGEDPVAAFNRHADQTAFVHFKDWNRVSEGGLLSLSGQRLTPALIGQGIVDYPALVEAMVQADYQGYVNLEYESSDISAHEALPLAHQYLLDLEAKLVTA